jgi:hypothetical protein
MMEVIVNKLGSGLSCWIVHMISSNVGQTCHMLWN